MKQGPQQRTELIASTDVNWSSVGSVSLELALPRSDELTPNGRPNFPLQLAKRMKICWRRSRFSRLGRSSTKKKKKKKNRNVRLVQLVAQSPTRTGFHSLQPVQFLSINDVTVTLINTVVPQLSGNFLKSYSNFVFKGKASFIISFHHFKMSLNIDEMLLGNY